MQFTNARHILNCNNLYVYIVRFIVYRMGINNKKSILCNKFYDSKSMYTVPNKRL